MPTSPDNTTKPLVTGGMRHVALNVDRLEACLDFYVGLIGMSIEWQPDKDNVFLCSGTDNLALHRRLDQAAPAPGNNELPARKERLDHIGFIIDDMGDVDHWHAKLVDAGVEIAQGPKTHRDGARSFYCHDPDGTLVQLIYHPPISKGAPSN